MSNETDHAVESPADIAVLPGTCRICLCTELAACPAGCGWVEPTLCSECADFINGIAYGIDQYMQRSAAGGDGKRLTRAINLALEEAIGLIEESSNPSLIEVVPG